ncbi:MAG: hypothetical protein U0414_01265 [Polyangiaceae bacterium]
MASSARLFGPLFLVLVGCTSSDLVDDTTSGSSGSSSSKASSSSAKASSADASSSTDATSSGVGGGTGGAGGATPWPTCDTQPSGSTSETIPQVWADDPALPTKVWLPGVFVTAVARGGCVAGQSCEIFIQQSESYATFALAAKQSLPIGIAPTVAEHFVGIQVGDKVDVYGSAFRNTQNGKNELGILVTPALRGCAKVVGTGNPTPVAVTLPELTTPYYEANGPALVQVAGVSGKPQLPDETFGLWDTVLGPMGTLEEVTSLSPFFLPSAVFTGFTQGQTTKFTSVTGVFAQFQPPMSMTKYEEICARTMNDIVLAP